MFQIRTKFKIFVVTSSLCLFSLLIPAQSTMAADSAKTASSEGKKLAFDKKKGNCLACHLIVGGDQPGNIGPPLIAMKARFPDKAKLRAQIWDATVVNPETSMPPFGRHQILSEKEIDAITDYIQSL